MNTTRIHRQLAFIREIDRLKDVERRTFLLHGRRRENDAEHSWHLAVMALLLREHCPEPAPDLDRVLQMLLVHDLVEIDAGDTYAYDPAAAPGQAGREQRAAERIFPILPDDQAGLLRTLWDEFETGDTPEACYARALDRLQPLLHNYVTSGKSWREHGVDADQVRERTRPIRDGLPALWTLAEGWIAEAVEKGWLKAGASDQLG